ncbi:hypothetical protein CBS101457_000731 [Exobasidium rhododendri]|nr:hypothetical protein CBS101457_000731 [Exobasidium rhododendri]
MKSYLPCGAFATFITLAASCAMAQQQTKPTQADDLASTLLNGLKAANLTAMAALATTHAQAMLPFLMSPDNKTIFVPSNEAVANASAQFGNASAKVIEAILSYHIINDTVTIKGLPDAFDYNIVLPTFLNNTAYTRLPKGAKQVVVLEKPNTKEPIDIKFGSGDVHFATTLDGPAVGNIQIQTVDKVMMPPANFTSMAALDGDLKAFNVALTQLNLSTAVNTIKGITLFAPITAAIAKVQDQISAAPHNDTVNVFLNHIINGTILYSPQLPASEEENESGSDSESHKTTNVTTAGGAALSFTYGKDGKVLITSGDSSAKIIRSDVLLDNGVIHYIDTVLANPLANATAAQKVAGRDQATAPLSATLSSNKDTESSGASVLRPAGVCFVTAATVLLSYIFL